MRVPRLRAMSRTVPTQVPSLVGPLSEQLSAICGHVPGFSVEVEAERVLLTGSCARGEATWRSDVDLLVVLRLGPLTYSRVRSVRDAFDARVGALSDRPLPVQVSVMLAETLADPDPGTKLALRDAIAMIEAA